MRSFLAFLIQPLPLLWLLLLAGFIARRYRKRRLGKILLIAAGLWLVLITTPPLPRFLVHQLEKQYPPLAVAALPADSTLHIAVLGGGHTLDERLPPTGRLSENALIRLTEGIRLHRLRPGATLVFSGWSGSGGMSQAEVMRQAAIALGVDSAAIAVLPEPWNTRTEALAHAETFGTEHPLVLVTDAMHMPRAMLHFRNAGLDPLPAPANFRLKWDERTKSLFSWLKPSGGNVESMEAAVHEYAGMAWAWLGGD